MAIQRKITLRFEGATLDDLREFIGEIDGIKSLGESDPPLDIEWDGDGEHEPLSPAGFSVTF